VQSTTIDMLDMSLGKFGVVPINWAEEIEAQNNSGRRIKDDLICVNFVLRFLPDKLSDTFCLNDLMVGLNA
jgi:hypothetical protein